MSITVVVIILECSWLIILPTAGALLKKHHRPYDEIYKFLASSLVQWLFLVCWLVEPPKNA